jgi:hypothetical protein
MRYTTFATIALKSPARLVADFINTIDPKQTFHRRCARMWFRSRRAFAPKPVVRAAKLATLSTVPDHVLCTHRQAILHCGI